MNEKYDYYKESNASEFLSEHFDDVDAETASKAAKTLREKFPQKSYEEMATNENIDQIISGIISEIQNS